MPSSTLATQLTDLANQRADALDRLIYSDYRQYAEPTGPLVILEDQTFALTLWVLANLFNAESPAEPEAEKPSGAVLVRLRSFAAAHELRALVEKEAAEALPHLRIAGLSQAGHTDYSTLALADFLEANNYQGNTAIGRLPKSHGALADWATDFSSVAGENATLVLGGNTKHMSHTFNETLGKSFNSVRGLRGKGKHRCLLATEPRPEQTARVQASPSQKGELVAHGGVFSGARADRGGRLLAQCALEYLRKHRSALTVLDFGCGNGSVSLDLLIGGAAGAISRVIATDIDADAVRSARANLAAYPQVEVTWDDAAAGLEAGSVDLVLLNPPFHEGTRVDLTLVQPLLDAALRVLKPGGTLLLVHNSHARYRGEVEARFKKVEQVARDKTFTVLRAE